MSINEFELFVFLTRVSIITPFSRSCVQFRYAIRFNLLVFLIKMSREIPLYMYIAVVWLYNLHVSDKVSSLINGEGKHSNSI